MWWSFKPPGWGAADAAAPARGCARGCKGQRHQGWPAPLRLRRLLRAALVRAPALPAVSVSPHVQVEQVEPAELADPEAPREQARSPPSGPGPTPDPRGGGDRSLVVASQIGHTLMFSVE